MIANTGEEPLFAAGFILPEDQAALPGSSASGPFGLRVPFPEFPTGDGVEGNDLAGGRSGIKHAGDDQIVGLVFAFVAGIVGPCDFELSDRASVDLLERRVKASPFIAKIGWPVDIGGRRRRGHTEDGQWDGQTRKKDSRSGISYQHRFTARARGNSASGRAARWCR